MVRLRQDAVLTARRVFQAHVDEVANDQPPDRGGGVGGDFVGGLKVDAIGCFLGVFGDAETAGVHIYRDQGLGLFDHQDRRTASGTCLE